MNKALISIFKIWFTDLHPREKNIHSKRLETWRTVNTTYAGLEETGSLATELTIDLLAKQLVWVRSRRVRSLSQIIEYYITGIYIAATCIALINL